MCEWVWGCGGCGRCVNGCGGVEGVGVYCSYLIQLTGSPCTPFGP